MKAYASLWSADLLALGEEVDLVDALVDGYHLDMMDGVCVPDLLFGLDVVAALRRTKKISSAKASRFRRCRKAIPIWKAFPARLLDRFCEHGVRDERFENRVEALVPSAYGIICIADPDTITSILLLTAQARGSLALLALIAAALGLVFLITRFVIGLWAERLMRLLGPGGLHVVTRVLGILLAALAVQFVLSGDKRVRAGARAGRLEPTSIPW